MQSPTDGRLILVRVHSIQTKSPAPVQSNVSSIFCQRDFFEIGRERERERERDSWALRGQDSVTGLKITCTLEGKKKKTTCLIDMSFCGLFQHIMNYKEQR